METSVHTPMESMSWELAIAHQLVQKWDRIMEWMEITCQRQSAWRACKIWTNSQAWWCKTRWASQVKVCIISTRTWTCKWCSILREVAMIHRISNSAWSQTTSCRCRISWVCRICNNFSSSNNKLNTICSQQWSTSRALRSWLMAPSNKWTTLWRSTKLSSRWRLQSKSMRLARCWTKEITIRLSWCSQNSRTRARFNSRSTRIKCRIRLRTPSSRSSKLSEQSNAPCNPSCELPDMRECHNCYEVLTKLWQLAWEVQLSALIIKLL